VVEPDHERFEVERLIDYWTPLVVRLCGEAGVFAAFGDDERTTDSVAASVGVHPGTLARFVRALAARGVFEAAGNGAVRLTALGRRLVPGAPGSLAGLANVKPHELHAWAEAEHSLRTGEASFSAHYGASFFDWMAQHPDANRRFNDTMGRKTSTLLDAGLPLMSWPETGTVVDVGGGNGVLLERVLGGRPGLRGVLFDQSHVVPAALERLRAAGLADRAEIVTGSFFEAIPAGHDVYVLSNILHDWEDERAVAILERCREAMRPAASLVLFEAVLVDDGTPDLGQLLDLHMLILLGARERTAAEWEELLRRGGFALDRITPTPGFAWIEARPAP
jgi:hypothetical protein